MKTKALLLSLVLALNTTPVFAQAQLPAYIDVTDFGAVGDGMTDDQQALQEAFNYGAAHGIPVYVPPGTYLHSNMLEVKGTIFGAKNNLSRLVATNYFNSAVRVRANDVGIYSLDISSIYGPRGKDTRDIRALESTATGIYVYEADWVPRGLTVANCHVHDTASVGINSWSCDDATLLNNFIEYSHADGILWASRFKNLEMGYNRVFRSGDDGLAVNTSGTKEEPSDARYGGYGRIHHNTVEGNETCRGIAINGNINMEVDHNYVSESTAPISCGGTDAWTSWEVRNLRVHHNTLKYQVLKHATGHMGAGIVLFNDYKDSLIDRNEQYYNNDIVEPTYFGLRVSGQGQINANVFNNNFYMSDRNMLYDFQNPGATNVKLFDNSYFKPEDYPGDMIDKYQAGINWDNNWGMPDTGDQYAKIAAATDANGNALSHINDDVYSVAEGINGNEVILSWDEEQTFNTVSINDYESTVAAYEIYAEQDGEWVQVAKDNWTDVIEGNRRASFDNVSFRKDVTTKQLKLILTPEQDAVKINEIGIYYDITPREPIQEDYRLTFGESATIGEDMELVISRKNTADRDMKIKLAFSTEFSGEDLLEFTFPANQKQTTVKVPINKSAVVNEYMPYKKAYYVKNHPVVATVFDGEEIIAKKRHVYNLKNPISITNLKLCDNEQGEMQLEITFENATNRMITGTLSVTDKTGMLRDEVLDVGTISSGEPTKIYLPVAKDLDPSKAYEPSFTFAPSVGDTITLSRKYGSFKRIPYAPATPTIDGTLEDEVWKDAPSIEFNDISQTKTMYTWDGVEDLSGTAKMLWDDENFYLALDVTDDIHIQKNEGVMIWSGDSIQLGLQSDREAYGGIDGYNELGFTLQGDGVLSAYRWIGANGFGESDFTNQANFKIVRNGNKTTYEIAIPWKNLSNKLIPTEGSNIGFSLVLVESDEHSRDGMYVYYDGITAFKSSATFADFILVK